MSHQSEAIQKRSEEQERPSEAARSNNVIAAETVVGKPPIRGCDYPLPPLEETYTYLTGLSIIWPAPAGEQQESQFVGFMMHGETDEDTKVDLVCGQSLPYELEHDARTGCIPLDIERIDWLMRRLSQIREAIAGQAPYPDLDEPEYAPLQDDEEWEETWQKHKQDRAERTEEAHRHLDSMVLSAVKDDDAGVWHAAVVSCLAQSISFRDGYNSKLFLSITGHLDELFRTATGEAAERLREAEAWLVDPTSFEPPDEAIVNSAIAAVLVAIIRDFTPSRWRNALQICEDALNSDAEHSHLPAFAVWRQLSHHTMIPHGAWLPPMPPVAAELFYSDLGES